MIAETEAENAEPVATAPVAPAVAAPAERQSVALVRAALLAFADEVAADPDNYYGGVSRVRQAASSPYIRNTTLKDIVASIEHSTEIIAERAAREAKQAARRQTIAVLSAQGRHEANHSTPT